MAYGLRFCIAPSFDKTVEECLILIHTTPTGTCMHDVVRTLGLCYINVDVRHVPRYFHAISRRLRRSRRVLLNFIHQRCYRSDVL